MTIKPGNELTNGKESRERRGTNEERYSVSFSVSLMWEEGGLIRRVNGRCVDLSPAGIKVETKERLESGRSVMVSCNEFGRMGHATVRHVRRQKMQCEIGLRFAAAFGLGDPARRKILARVISLDAPTPEPAGTPA